MRWNTEWCGASHPDGQGLYNKGIVFQKLSRTSEANVAFAKARGLGLE